MGAGRIGQLFLLERQARREHAAAAHLPKRTHTRHALLTLHSRHELQAPQHGAFAGAFVRESPEHFHHFFIILGWLGPLPHACRHRCASTSARVLASVQGVVNVMQFLALRAHFTLFVVWA